MGLIKLGKIIIILQKGSCPDKRQVSETAKINMGRKTLSCFHELSYRLMDDNHLNFTALQNKELEKAAKDTSPFIPGPAQC